MAGRWTSMQNGIANLAGILAPVVAGLAVRTSGSSKPAFVVTGLIVLVAILGGVFLVWRTMPPRIIVMATGAQGGAYFEVGQRYRELLAREGIELRLVPTSGSLENLALLRNPGSGVSSSPGQPGLDVALSSSAMTGPLPQPASAAAASKTLSARFIRASLTHHSYGR